MVRLIALYRQPPDPQAFDAHYRDIHGPLVRTYPGLAGVTVTKLTGLGGQNPVFYQMAEMRFASRADLDDRARLGRRPRQRAGPAELRAGRGRAVRRR